MGETGKAPTPGKEKIERAMSKKFMIGGCALAELGSSRNEQTLQYLVSKPDHEDLFIYQSKNEVWINAPRHPFYSAIWERESATISPFAPPQSLFEIAVFMWSNNRKNGFWERKINDEFDIKFLARKYNINSFPIVADYVGDDDLAKIKHMIGNKPEVTP